jgi:hypothetical protein
MKKFTYILLASIIITVTIVAIKHQKVNAPALNDDIRVTSPIQYATITSPVTITGEALGGWFFEASFPITLVDWDGLIIGQGVAQAKGDWMTADFVPFEAKITFAKPPYAGEQSKRGAIILKNDNPSGQASTSRSIEIPIVFQ